MSFLLAIIIGLISIIVPGFFLSLALLKKTGLHIFEIAVIGFIFGLIFPPTMIWLESYLIPLSPAFAFSNGLYNANVVILAIIGIVLCIQQGALGMNSLSTFGKSSINIRQDMERDHKKRLASIRERLSSMAVDMKLVKEHQREEDALSKRHAQEMQSASSLGEEERKKIAESHAEQERRLFEQHEAEEKGLLQEQGGSAQGQKSNNIIWIALLVIMVLTFATRMLSIGAAPTYFEFDPYYDMISTQFILVHGYQILYSHSAWPSLTNGTIQRIQPIVPYLEAYWYNLLGANPGSSTVNTTQLSLVSSYYPPITAALLVFVVFMFLYHEYGEFEAIIGAGLAAAMPVLISTFISGEQLLEPWGIFAMFFFFAAYLLAVNNPKEKRYAILAGIAFASNFLGAHYYTVPAGILAVYIVVQGIIQVFRKQDNLDFYKMNLIMLAIIVVSYAAYNAYGATLTERTPSLLGIPVIVSFPIAAIIFLALFEYIPKLAKERNLVSNLDLSVKTYALWLAAIIIISVLLILLTPLGKPFQQYVALSIKFTTPSSPLFMTVQEYAPTGLNYDFGSAGFGLIGSSIGGVNIIVLAVLALFVGLEIIAIMKRNSRSSILSLIFVVGLAAVGMGTGISYGEVKYLPHFGVGYIIAICVILGEIALQYSDQIGKDAKTVLSVVGVAILIVEAAPVAYSLIGAAANPTCSAVSNANNQIGSILYCNTIQVQNPGWLQALAWMKANVGPYAPRILSWWDYGDWINWFGNSNAVLRGDNSVATADYAAAAHYVFTPQDGYTTSALASYMDGIQAKYILLDNELVPKWGALDFLACVDTNQTSEQYALAQGQQYGQPYVLGTSGCEVSHDPAYIYIAISQNLNSYCQFSNNATAPALKAIVVVGQSPTNTTYCVPESFFSTGNATYLLSSNGTKTNALVSSGFYGGQTTISGTQFISFLLLFAPNAPNDTITNAPSQFYNSTYYKGFFLGKLSGFNLAYPSNFTGINYVNSTNPVMIFELPNYTGGLPPVTPKASWVANNYTMPG